MDLPLVAMAMIDGDGVALGVSTLSLIAIIVLGGHGLPGVEMEEKRDGVTSCARR